MADQCVVPNGFEEAVLTDRRRCSGQSSFTDFDRFYLRTLETNGRSLRCHRTLWRRWSVAPNKGHCEGTVSAGHDLSTVTTFFASRVSLQVVQIPPDATDQLLRLMREAWNNLQLLYASLMNPFTSDCNPFSFSSFLAVLHCCSDVRNHVHQVCTASPSLSLISGVASS